MLSSGWTDKCKVAVSNHPFMFHYTRSSCQAVSRHWANCSSVTCQTNQQWISLQYIRFTTSYKLTSDMLSLLAWYNLSWQLCWWHEFYRTESQYIWLIRYINLMSEIGVSPCFPLLPFSFLIYPKEKEESTLAAVGRFSRKSFVWLLMSWCQVSYSATAIHNHLSGADTNTGTQQTETASLML